MIKYMLVATVMAGLGGCASLTPNQVVKPSEATIESALGDIGKGLAAMHKNQGEAKTGMIATELTVTLKLDVSAGDHKTLTVAAATPAAASASASLGIGFKTDADASRGSQITLKFVNLLALEGDNIAKHKSAQDIRDLYKILGEATSFIFVNTNPVK